jgi:hypothetical protein
VHVRIIEGTRERIQVFEGVVIKRRGGGISETFTVCVIAIELLLRLICDYSLFFLSFNLCSCLDKI